MTSTPTAKKSDANHPDAESAGTADSWGMLDAANADWLTRSLPVNVFEDNPAEGSLLLIIDIGGTVRSNLEAPAVKSGSLPEVNEGQSLADCWPEELVTPIMRNCQSVIRSRQVRNVRVRSTALEREYEFIFIAQGRDTVMLVARDITDTQKRISRLEQLAFEDPATQLPNKEWLLHELGKALDRQTLSGGRLALILLEIGQLDVVEDTSPQFARDAILRELAERMQNGLRGANQRDERDDERYSAVARVDQRLFGILLPSIETGEDAAAVASRIVSDLEEPLSVAGKQATVRIATGIALHPQDGSTSDELFDSAMMATTDARNSETVQQRFHSGTVRMRALERQDVEAELRAALDNEEFTLNFQPIVEGETGKVVSAEALLRWPKPLFGSKPISEVVAVAEYTGLILPIGEWIFRTACEQLAAWQSGGLDGFEVAVNVSAQEFARADLVERTERLLQATGVQPEHVVLEITERLLFRDSVNDFAICRQLKEIGVKISVDDYGTGVCSFDHLSRSPVDSVKIHPDIVARSAGGSPSRAACAAVTAMAHALDIRVVAEGVETEDQADALRRIGCDFLQGYLFGRPAEPDAFTELWTGGQRT